MLRSADIRKRIDQIDMDVAFYKAGVALQGHPAWEEYCANLQKLAANQLGALLVCTAEQLLWFQAFAGLLQRLMVVRQGSPRMIEQLESEREGLQKQLKTLQDRGLDPADAGAERNP